MRCWESGRKAKSDSVDFALLLQRAPCLFLEAKALRASLDDHRMVKQILGYAAEAGAQWVVLTNGEASRIYNAIAPVPAEQKVFRTVSISKDPPEVVATTLGLLSKANLQDKKISRLWESHFVDRQVESQPTLTTLGVTGDPADSGRRPETLDKPPPRRFLLGEIS